MNTRAAVYLLLGILFVHCATGGPAVGEERRPLPRPGIGDRIPLLSPDCTVLAEVQLDGTVRLANLRDGKQLPLLKLPGRRYFLLSFSRTGKTLATVCDGTFIAWAVPSGKVVSTFRASGDRLSPDGKTLYLNRG